ncbi:MAG TPA: PilZ domain-containing protein [Terriglobales bacterium]|nr:PilZ domain-containing protein [Terriglobales bacterium]
MKLRALLLCSEEKIMRVLRRVLSDLEIDIDHCPDADTAVHKLTRDQYECVIVDCEDDEIAGQVLKSARSAPRNKRSVAVAIIDSQKVVRSAFDLGAHFVLYKPISAERAKNSFRAARALMKKERRRNFRIPVRIPVVLVPQAGASRVKAETSDVGEGGLALRLPQAINGAGQLGVVFTLPDIEEVIECKGEIAWHNSGRQAGLRFVDLPSEAHNRIKAWLDNNNPDKENDDPPVPGKLTDLSQGGCYMEMAAPFPVRTKVTLSVPSGEKQVQVEGIVRVAHPEIGMGVEFAQGGAKQIQQVQAFIVALMSSGSEIPELQVQPEGLEASLPQPAKSRAGHLDPLLDLFVSKAFLPAEEFQVELLKQRNHHTESEGAVNA